MGDILAVVDGVIVASALKVDGYWWNSVDPERATASSIGRVASPMTQGEVTFSEQMRSQTKAAWDAATAHQGPNQVPQNVRKTTHLAFEAVRAVGAKTFALTRLLENRQQLGKR